MDSHTPLKYFTLLTSQARSSSSEMVDTDGHAEKQGEGEQKLSKKQLKKLAKRGGVMKKKDKPKWNLPGEGKEGKAKKEKKLNLNEDEVFVNTTVAGEKKDLSGPIAEKYNPTAVEAAWDLWWEKKGYYTCSPEEVKGLKPEEKFVMVLPPPNVTGTLHIGHALMVAVEDALARYNRMLGKKVLWVPGLDHAGIGTQAAVEAKIWKEEKKTRHDFTREEFLKRVWAFKEEKGGLILQQIRCMGASVDHSREVFTMDEKRQEAVAQAFVKMYDMGLIYRKTRLVNWSSQLSTAISDIEVDSKELEKRTMLPIKSHGNRKYEFGVLTEFKYPVADSPSGEMVTVATTRLETMLGDTAVCVHPEDPRYQHLHGKFVKHPFFPRLLPIVTDAELVDMEFGTGCVKITPAHDENDYLCGEKHSLPMLNMLSDDGRIDVTECKPAGTECPGDKYHGMMRYDARVALEKDLAELGLLGEKKDNKMVLPVCSRSSDIVEPRLKPQWWVDTTEMARRSVEVVETGELELVPSFHKDTWYRFLRDPHQWCISRQLWWGHRIPAYRVAPKTAGDSATAEKLKEKKLEWIVAESYEVAVEKAKKLLQAADCGIDASQVELIQDEDVLDTWFSSGLFPFSVFNWPEKTDDLEGFFPGTLLETGHDILFFWVARMVMMSLTLENVLPFRTVYLHAIVRDRYGRKMSKSLGNIIDPLAVIRGCSLKELNDTIKRSNLPEAEIKKAVKGQQVDFPDGIPQCGSDALRFGLLSSINQGRDINLDINNVFSTRKFCNKLWQVTKFSMILCGDALQPEPDFLKKVNQYSLTHRDKWILTELKKLVINCNKAMEKYYFGEYANNLTVFWVGKLCDVYVESIKPLVRKAGDATADPVLQQQLLVSRNVLFNCLDIGLKLLHPLMPFVSEELWQHLPGNKDRLLQYNSEKEAATGFKESIMVSKYPVEQDLFSEDFSKEVDLFEIADTIAHAMRSLKSDYNITKKDVCFYGFCDVERLEKLKQLVDDMNTLGSGVVVLEEEAKASDYRLGFISMVIDGHLQVMMEVKGNVDIQGRIKKLEKERAQSENSVEQITKKLANTKFVSNAPQKVLDETKEKLVNLTEVVSKLTKQIEDLRLLDQ